MFSEGIFLNIPKMLKNRKMDKSLNFWQIVSKKAKCQPWLKSKKEEEKDRFEKNDFRN